MTFRLDYDPSSGVLEIFECPMLFSAGKAVLFTSRVSNGDRLVVRVPSVKSVKVLRNASWHSVVVFHWWSINGDVREFSSLDFVKCWQLIVKKYRVARFSKQLYTSESALEVLSLLESVDFGPL